MIDVNVFVSYFIAVSSYFFFIIFRTVIVHFHFRSALNGIVERIICSRRVHLPETRSIVQSERKREKKKEWKVFLSSFQLNWVNELINEWRMLINVFNNIFLLWLNGNENPWEWTVRTDWHSFLSFIIYIT